MLLYWIWFAELKKLSVPQKQWLLEHFHDPEDIYLAREEALLQVEGMTAEIVDALEDKSLDEARRIAGECGRAGIGILTCTDAAYPRKLRSTYDPPVLLYYKGILPQWDDIPVIGVVGTRKATFYGINTAERYSRQIAACGALVVSGGASGIDTAALQGAMQTGKPVVAVLGGGVDVVYPKANEALFAAIAENGCLLSEYRPEPRPWAGIFPCVTGSLPVSPTAFWWWRRRKRAAPSALPVTRWSRAEMCM